METAQSVINDSLQAILVQASEQPIEAVDFQTSRRYLNRMMATTPYNGLGFTQITNPDDLVTIPDGALEGVIFNLAKKMLSTYDMPLTAELNNNARDGLQEIRRITVSVQPTPMPCTLPIGSGNESENTFNNQHFYPCPDNKVLTESGGSILLESDTNNG
tara:strand:+ start:2180 stop:2659 length:480 start_codon:yes stop_codon:yes gene_type:complete